MKVERLEARLARQFRARPQRLGEARITWRKTPVPLWRHAGTAPAFPDTVVDVLGERLVDVLSFTWLGETPLAFSAAVKMLDLGERGYLCVWNECHSFLAVARLDPWQDELVLSAAVKQLLHENGRRYGLEVFGSIPHETVNFRPELVFTAVVKQAYFDWLQWAWKDPPPSRAWARVSSEPTPADEWLAVARAEPVITVAKDALRSWEALADIRLQQRFDRWFELAYRVG
jgi:hypothetical protein